jgi:hypothetical protein
MIPALPVLSGFKQRAFADGQAARSARKEAMAALNTAAKASNPTSHCSARLYKLSVDIEIMIERGILTRPREV